MGGPHSSSGDSLRPWDFGLPEAGSEPKPPSTDSALQPGAGFRLRSILMTGRHLRIYNSFSFSRRFGNGLRRTRNGKFCCIGHRPRLRSDTERSAVSRNNRSFPCPCPPAAAQPPKPVSTGGLSSRRAENDDGSSGRNRLTPMRVHSYLHLALQRISDCIWLCGETRCRSASDSGPCSHAARLPPALDSCAGIEQFGAKYLVRQSVHVWRLGRRANEAGECWGGSQRDLCE